MIEVHPPGPRRLAGDLRNLLLMAEAGGARATVGVIRREKEIEVLERAGDEARVWVRTKAIHAADGATLRVRAADLAGCRGVADAPAPAR